MRELTIQQQAFVREFSLNGGRGTDAAIKAGYSADSAAQRAYELRQKAHIQEAINRELRRAFTDLAAIAVGQVRAMLTDPKTPASARVDLMKTVLDRAGLGPVKEDDAGRVDERSLREFSLTELEAMLVTIKVKREPAPAQLEPVTVGEASIAEDAEQGPPAIDQDQA